MRNVSKDTAYPHGLRKRALEIIHQDPQSIASLPSDDIENLAHELSVYQIELEMQNEHLREAQTELERSRDEYTGLYDFAPVGYSTLSTKGLIQKSNLTLSSMLGVERSYLLQKPISKYILTEDMDKFYLHRQRILETKQQQECQLRLNRHDKSTFWVNLRSVPVQDGHGDVDEIRVVITDITQLREANDILARQMSQLRQADNVLYQSQQQERDRIARGLHDSIIQPLIFLKINLELLDGNQSSSKKNDIRNGMKKTISDLIKVTREFTFDLSYPILYELGLQAAIEEWLSVEIEDKHGIKTVFTHDGLDKPLQPSLRSFLFESFRELLVNIIKHAKAENVRVNISRKGDLLVMEVKDDGIGFVNSEESSFFNKKGGFGLFSVRERLSNFNGNLEILSNPGKGTKVKIIVHVKNEGLSEVTSKEYIE